MATEVIHAKGLCASAAIRQVPAVVRAVVYNEGLGARRVDVHAEARSSWPRFQLPRDRRAFGRTGSGESVSDEPIEVTGQQGWMKRFELTA